MVKHEIFFASAALCILLLFAGCGSNNPEQKTAAGNAKVTRTLPVTVNAGENITVSLTMTVNGSLSAIGLEEDYPAGWNVSNIPLHGVLKDNPDRIEWLFWPLGEPITNRTFNYTITAPAAYSGTAAFSGKVITKGTNAIEGDTSVKVVN